MHRGLDPAAAGHADNNVIFVLCHPVGHERGGKKNYSCTFKYTVQLAECCNRVVNAGIFEFLDSHGFLSPDGDGDQQGRDSGSGQERNSNAELGKGNGSTSLR